MNIFVGSLPFSLEEAELKGFFEEYGEVTSARIITDKFSGRSKGFGFAEFETEELAQQAIDALNEQEFNGRKMTVNKARKMEPRSNNFGGGSGGRSSGGFREKRY